MSTNVTLEAKLRTETGKGAARTIRRDGYIPAVVYGHGAETRACKIPTKDFERLVATGSHESTLIDLKMDDGDLASVLVREVQIHPYRAEILHVDFLAVRKGEKVKLDVPVRLLGIAPGVKEGGIMEHLRHDVEIRCVPAKIPEALEFDITEMDIGDNLTVADLEAPEGVEILDDPGTTIASIVPPAVLKVEEEVEEVEAVEGEEPAEPELVGRGKTAEDEAAEEEG
jgi:large subunit ribosomal protein L25